MLLHLNDSKQVPRKKREILYDIIREKAVAYGIGVVSEKRIDEINILQANLRGYAHGNRESEGTAGSFIK